MKKLKSISMVALLVIFIALIPNTSLAASIKPIVEKAVVTRVVDGDTVEAKLANGKVYKVRLIGVNTPESTTKIEPYGKEASNYTKSKLQGKTVYLEKDAGNTDKYGRLLRYIWLSPPINSTDTEMRSKMFNAILVEQGYAQIMTVPPNVKYSKQFVPLQKIAADKKSGLWGVKTLTPTKPTSVTSSVSNQKPKQKSSVTLSAAGPVGGKVTAICRYKSKNTTYTGNIGANGKWSLPINIGSATKGYKVIVDITVTANGKTYKSQTSFTPM